MSYKKTAYVSKQSDANGIIPYTDDENAIWEELYTRQMKIIENRACPEYISGIHYLNLTKNKIPQCKDVSAVLKEMTGWVLEPVPALIPFDKFFNLLANRKFPAATFIRSREELNYLQEPDIFHEVFGHCPLLTDKRYAEFTHTYGKLGLNASHEDRILLARLYWFTVEFGLIQTKQGIRAYGGGILSSMNETVYCLESDIPKRLPFDPIEALRTPYRIDVMQPIYFVLENLNQLYELIDMDLIKLIHQAKALGEYPSNDSKID